MSIQYDEKGKIFTNIVSKSPIPAVIQTITHRIEGCLYTRPGTRIKDELNQADPFIAVTDAVVFDQTGNLLYERDFIAINRDHVVWVIPDEKKAAEYQPGGAE